MIRSKPTLVFDILRLLPYAIRDIRHNDKSMRLGQLPDDFPPGLLRAGRRGLIEGGLMYAYEAITDRRRGSVMVSHKDSARPSADALPLTAGHDNQKPGLPEKQNVSCASK
jgi:hypothetical protein